MNQINDVSTHYQQHLAPIYEWLSGGFEAACERAKVEIEHLALHQGNGLIALDLGAGFGAHSAMLLQQGFQVIALDSSEYLLNQLRINIQEIFQTQLKIVCADIFAFSEWLNGCRPTLILCMGDTLTHLSSLDNVEALLVAVANALAPEGIFVATFRDYSQELLGCNRFIHVKSDTQRIASCFLEYTPTHVLVHDVLHVYDGTQWQMQVSAYPKIRLSVEFVCNVLINQGLQVKLEAGLAGMVKVVAQRF